jgi:hypothetical protein
VSVQSAHVSASITTPNNFSSLEKFWKKKKKKKRTWYEEHASRGHPSFMLFNFCYK